MIRINRLEDISESKSLSMEMKKELQEYFREIAEGIADVEWETYSLEEIGEILIIEEDDDIDVLDEYGIMQGSNIIPRALPEFSLCVTVGKIDMVKIIWVCSDSFGISVYYPKGKFGKDFDEWLENYLID